MSPAVLRAGSGWTLAIALVIAAGSLTAQQPNGGEKKPKNRNLHWSPPEVDLPLHSRISSPPCELPNVLGQAGARANDLVTNLQNFTAQEKIDYQAFGRMNDLLDGGSGTFDYVVVFEQHPEGFSVQESRTPANRSHAFPASSQDVGLPDMALLFLPEMQGDYEMKCEGTVEWNAQPAWVVHFQQRKDRPSHTVSFNHGGAVYPAKLKGRAWIVPDSGEVIHMETSLMEKIVGANVEDWYLSIDYAPVQFRTQNVRVWLPRTVDAYCQFDDRRTLLYHTFSNFMLFSVHTDQEIQKPQNP